LPGAFLGARDASGNPKENVMHHAQTWDASEHDGRTPEEMMEEVLRKRARAKTGAAVGAAAMALGVLALGYMAVTGVVDPGGKGAAAAAQEEGIPRGER
jgi:hypothetical protein